MTRLLAIAQLATAIYVIGAGVLTAAMFGWALYGSLREDAVALERKRCESYRDLARTPPQEIDVINLINECVDAGYLSKSS